MNSTKDRQITIWQIRTRSLKSFLHILDWTVGCMGTGESTTKIITMMGDGTMEKLVNILPMWSKPKD